jgi:anion-transporting  ArsA/GET3 family ATPase
MSVVDQWLKCRTLVCVGSGGVGKTTTSAALGVLAAKKGLRVLVMTIDPALRLKVALGITPSNEDAVVVPGQNYKGKLSASLLNSEKIFTEFIRSAGKNSEASERLVKNRLYQQLSTTLSGSQEFTALLQLTRMLRSDAYDLVILDTPPAQHAIDFLEAPEKLYALFQESIVRWFVGESESDTFVRKMISRGTRTVLSLLERVTGSTFMAELADFFKSIRALQEQIAVKTTEVRNLLRAEDTNFLLVTGFDEAKLIEAQELRNYLDSRGFHLRGTVINRAFPLWAGSVHKTPAGAEFDAIRPVAEELSRYLEEREKIFDKFAKGWGENLPVLRIPDLNIEIVGLANLEELANEFSQRSL